MKPHSKLKNVIFAGAALLIFFGLFEAVLRVIGFEYLPGEHPMVVMHEFGHIFGGLADEYVDERYYANIGF